MKTRITAILVAVLWLLSLFLAGCGNVSRAPSTQGKGKAIDGVVTIHYIDVGQGDAILIHTPHKAVLIDSGDVVNEQKEHPVVTYLKKQGIKTLDMVIITHPHADHIGGMQPVFNAFSVKQVYDSGQPTTTQLYKQYLQTIKQKNIPFATVRAGTDLDLGDGVSLKFMHPQATLMTGTSSDLNNNSVVTRLVFGQISCLFVGDIEKEAETILLKQPGALKSDILKVGHHGSNTSSSDEFIKAVSPKAAVIMCGLNNDYHHPHERTLKKYEQANIKVYRTDLNGTIIVTTDGKQYEIKAEK